MHRVGTGLLPVTSPNRAIRPFIGVALMAVSGLAGDCFAGPEVCDTVSSAGIELENALEQAYSCVSSHDYSNDCSGEADRLEDALAEYDDAVDQAEALLADEVTNICEVPIHLAQDRVHGT